MLACLLDETNKIILKELPTPSLTSGDILVKMEASGICGTDLEKISGKLGKGGILGHEESGTIQDPINSTTGFSPGDRVIVHHHVPCYACATCRKGDPTMCGEFKKTNLVPCGLATYFKVPKYNVERGAVIPLPDQLSFEEGALIEPTACCVRAIRRVQPKHTDNVLVIGLGPTGLTQIQLLRNQTSGRIFGSDTIESRRKMGERLGADGTLDPRTEDVPGSVQGATGGGADLVVVATGNERALDQAFASVRKGGKILLFGAPSIGASFQLDVSRTFGNQISLITSYSCTEPEMHEVIRLVAEKEIDLSVLISHRFRLKEADKALEHARTSKYAIKTVVAA